MVPKVIQVLSEKDNGTCLLIKVFNKFEEFYFPSFPDSIVVEWRQLIEKVQLWRKVSLIK